MKSLDDFLNDEIGVSPHFFSEIKKNDDWACIVKLASLTEAAMTHLLVRHFDDERLSDVFSQMDSLDRKRGKMAFIAALNLLPSEYRGFIQQMAEVRNTFAHQISTSKFRLKVWINSLPPERRKNLYTAMERVLGGDGEDEFRFFRKTMTRLEFVELYPRLAITVCAAMVIYKVLWTVDPNKSQLEETIRFVIGSRSEPRRSTPKG